MIPRFIATPMQTIGYAVLMAAAVLAGCSDDAEDPPPPPPPVDAAPSSFVVRGTATGILGPLTLELRLGDEVEPLTITEGGPFVFETTLADGASYTVGFDNPDAPCNLSNETGTVAGADPTVEVSCAGPSPATVLVSGVDVMVDIVPGMTDYVVEVPFAQETATLSGTASALGDDLSIAGTPVYGGQSVEIPLSVGDNPVDIAVVNPLSWRRTYVLTLHRAAEITQ